MTTAPRHAPSRPTATSAPAAVAAPDATSRSRFAALEGWRGAACLMVFCYHCGLSQPRPPLAAFGFTGVHLFFVLSGFLLFRPYASALTDGRPVPPTGNFYLRRLVRIGPPYLVSLAAFVALRLVVRVNVPSAWDVVAHALLVFNYDPRLNFFGINPVYLEPGNRGSVLPPPAGPLPGVRPGRRRAAGRRRRRRPGDRPGHRLPVCRGPVARRVLRPGRR